MFFVWNIPSIWFAFEFQIPCTRSFGYFKSENLSKQLLISRNSFINSGSSAGSSIGLMNQRSRVQTPPGVFFNKKIKSDGNEKTSIIRKKCRSIELNITDQTKHTIKIKKIIAKSNNFYCFAWKNELFHTYLPTPQWLPIAKLVMPKAIYTFM